MGRSRSIFDSLTRGFLAMGALGSIILFLLGIFDLEDLIGGAGVRTGPSRITPELIEHALFPVLFLLLPLFIAARWVIRRSLAPLEAAAELIDAAPGMSRGFRVDMRDLPTEAVPFVTAVNNLLQRLDDVAARLEAFAADAAHELKTPLAVLLLELESLKDSDAARLKADVAEVSRLVDHLLLLAQLDADAASPIPFESVELEAVGRDVATQTRPLAAVQDKKLQLEIADRPAIPGRPEAIKAALRNLVENGLRATPRGGAVTIGIGPGPLIRVRDGGPGLSVEELDRLRHRCKRADHVETPGFGLGLAIVSRIMTLHGGSLVTVPEQCELQLVFPDAGKSGETEPGRS